MNEIIYYLSILFIFYNFIFGFKQNASLYCGIVCFSGKSNFNLDKVNLLLYWNYKERGSDATGFYTPKTGLLKNCDKAEDFLVSQREKLIEDNLLIGHVRQGTVGKQNPSNAHPFEYKMEGKEGTIIGLQNGTLSNHHKLASEYNLAARDWDTDTQVLYQCMAKDCNPKVLTKLEGSAALAWTDTSIKDNTTLYIYRNSERPLYYGYLPEGMYISSIEKSLKVIGCTDIKQFETETLFTVKEGKIIKENKVVVKKKPIVNTSYTTYSNTPSNKQAISYKDTWVMADSDYNKAYGNPIKLTKGKFYFCLGPDETQGKADFYAKVIDDNGDEVTVSTYYFENKNFAPSVSKKAVVMEPVYDAKDLTLRVFDEGDVITITSQYSSNKGSFVCAQSKVNNTRYEIPVKMVRKALDDGSEDNLTNIKGTSTPIIQLPATTIKDEDSTIIEKDITNVDTPIVTSSKNDKDYGLSKVVQKKLQENSILRSMFKDYSSIDQVNEMEELLEEIYMDEDNAYCELSDVYKVCNKIIDNIERLREDCKAQENLGDLSVYGKYAIEEYLDEIETTIKDFFQEALYNTYCGEDIQYLARNNKKND